MAWEQFNESFERLQSTPWHQINAGTNHGVFMRLARLFLAYGARRRDMIVDLAGKARALWKLDIPRDPDIVFFGAEVGWEAAIVQALYGDGGRVVLIDNDPAAYERFCNAATERRCRAPRGFGSRELVVTREPTKMQYVKQDFFDVQMDGAFDVGIDWGVIEHYPDDRKQAVLQNFKRFLKPGGLEVTSTPRNALAVRLFYRAFRDELNFGYRELMSIGELRAHLERAGFRAERQVSLPAHNIIGARVA